MAMAHVLLPHLEVVPFNIGKEGCHRGALLVKGCILVCCVALCGYCEGGCYRGKVVVYPCN